MELISCAEFYLRDYLHPATAHHYRRILNSFVGYAISQGKVNARDVDISLIEDYVGRLGKSRAELTDTLIKCTLEQFVRWCSLRGDANACMPYMPVCLTKPTKRPVCPSQADVDATIGAASPTSIIILGTLAFGGVRAGELPSVEVDWDGDWLVVRRGKFGATRKIPLHPRLRALISGLSGKRWSVVKRSAVNSSRVETAKIGRVVSLHVLRVFFHHACIEAGIPIQIIAEWLGYQKSTAELSDEASQRYMGLVRFGANR